MLARIMKGGHNDFFSGNVFFYFYGLPDGQKAG